MTKPLANAQPLATTLMPEQFVACRYCGRDRDRATIGGCGRGLNEDSVVLLVVHHPNFPITI